MIRGALQKIAVKAGQAIHFKVEINRIARSQIDRSSEVGVRRGNGYAVGGPKQLGAIRRSTRLGVNPLGRPPAGGVAPPPLKLV